MKEHGFALHKGAFRDALCLRYTVARCMAPTGVTHSVCLWPGPVFLLNCPTGGYATLRHNELRDFTAKVLSDVCAD